MKSRWLAFLLNFLIAGVGFLYLRKWAWAAIDFVVTVAIMLVVVHRFPDAVSLASTVVSVSNGVLAAQAAQQMNAQI